MAATFLEFMLGIVGTPQESFSTLDYSYFHDHAVQTINPLCYGFDFPQR